MVTADNLLQHVLAASPWVDRASTVDRVIVGDGERAISTALVTWISSFAACREAVRRGVDLLVTHEPTFWNHHDDRPAVADPVAQEKLRFLEESGLVILRLHDSWDRFPEVGIPFAWARFLGFAGAPVRVHPQGCQHRYDLDPLPAGDFAQRVAARTAAVGEPVIQFVGDPELPVSRIGVGTGCGCGIEEYREMGCDLAVVCDDGQWYWGPIQRAADAGLPVVRVNHGTSEEPGMVTLAAYLQQAFPTLAVEHLPHACLYRPVGR